MYLPWWYFCISILCNVYLPWLLVCIHYILYDISVSTMCNVPWSTVYIIISPLNSYLFICICMIFLFLPCVMYRDLLWYHYKSTELVSIHMYLYDISVSTLCNVYLPWLLCVLLYYKSTDISVSFLCNVYLPWLLCVLLYYLFLFLPCVSTVMIFCISPCVMCLPWLLYVSIHMYLYDISVSTMCVTVYLLCISL